MKNLILSLTLATTAAVSAQNYKLEIEISGFKNDRGMARVGLYNSKDSFLEKSFKSVKTVVKNKKTYAVFTNLEKGDYAISMYHDENLNGKLDANFMGIPKEDYAASNGARGFMGPPKFDDAKFSLNADKKISLKIK